MVAAEFLSKVIVYKNADESCIANGFFCNAVTISNSGIAIMDNVIYNYDIFLGRAGGPCRPYIKRIQIYRKTLLLVL